MFHTFSCLAIGQSIIGQPCLTYQLTQNAQGMLQGVPVLSQTNLSGGALGGVTSVIGMLYTNPPVRTADYLASVGEGLGVVKQAHAQGVGGSGAAVLNPILKLWQVSRNISYVILILIFLVIGLMVMFRNKINPQTVITAQTALPGLVIGLVMITFSYFFAGLISDLAFVGTNVVGFYFTTAQNKPPEDLTQKISGSNILNIMGSLTGIIESGDVASFSGILFDSLGGEAQKAIRILVFWLSSQFVSGLIPDVGGTGNALTPLIKPIAGIITGIATNAMISPLLGQFLSLAAALALVYQLLKLLFKLIMTWLTIIFLTIIAPFQFLFASLPGRQGMATGWMLNMLGNILVFPAVIAVIYFVAFLLGPRFAANCPKDNTGSCLIQISAVNQQDDSILAAPVYAADSNDVIGTHAFPLFGGMDLSWIQILLAFGALMALPAIPDIIVRTVGKAGQAGQMIGQEVVGGGRTGQGFAQRSYSSGIQTGQTWKTGLLGETQVLPSGDTKVVKRGLFRNVYGWGVGRKP